MPDPLPTIALSIRQPWAWLIVNGHKDVENRSWATKHRGPFLVHASAAMTRQDHDDAQFVAYLLGVELPAPADLERGGIVGVAELTNCTNESDSMWFTGEQAFELANARPLPFRAYKGRLGWFEVEGGADGR